MLISRRKEGETLFIGEDIEIRIIDVRKKKVILGIIAPRNVRVVAEKLTEMAMENTMAAAHSADIGQFLPPSEKAESVVFMLSADPPSKKSTAPKKTEE